MLQKVDCNSRFCLVSCGDKLFPDALWYDRLSDEFLRVW